MSDVRPARPADGAAVADLFARTFRPGQGPASADLQATFAEMFFTGPWCEADLGSLVHARPDGTITGFMGVVPQRFAVGGETIRAAICGTLMVDGREDDPMAGARLMRSFLAGPQDISISETASEVSTAMWTRLRGTVLRDFSYRWLRILRPAGFAAHWLAERYGALRPLSALARPLDSQALKRARADDPRWWGFAPGPEDKLAERDTSVAELAELVPSLIADYDPRPTWDAATLERMLETSLSKRRFGAPALRLVTTPTGAPVGAYLYHGRAGGVAEVTQVLCAPKHAGALIEKVLAHAHATGAVAVAGRAQPALLDALLGKKAYLTHGASTVIHSKRADLVTAFAGQRGFLNGLAGEGWSRLIGDDFA